MGSHAVCDCCGHGATFAVLWHPACHWQVRFAWRSVRGPLIWRTWESSRDNVCRNHSEAHSCAGPRRYQGDPLKKGPDRCRRSRKTSTVRLDIVRTLPSHRPEKRRTANSANLAAAPPITVPIAVQIPTRKQAKSHSSAGGRGRPINTGAVASTEAMQGQISRGRDRFDSRATISQTKAVRAANGTSRIIEKSTASIYVCLAIVVINTGFR